MIDNDEIMILDLTKITDQASKERFRNNLIIPCCRSEYEADISVIEEWLDPTFIWEQKYRARRIARKRGFRSDKKSWIKPIGFDVDRIPEGAVIKKVSRNMALDHLK